MKPLRLTMRAFGSYPAEQVVDFRRLGRQSLFLICGPTGSGKSTILDAICYALYGETCSGDRTGAQLRSDLAKPDHETAVTLDFAIGSAHYRVVRRPEQERPKKKGGGTTHAGPSGTLWKRTAAAGDADDGEVVVTKPGDVTARVKELLGFDGEQFRQVIVLPQGRFRDLLTASSQEREEILAKLFQTGAFARIQDILKERAAGIKREADHLETRRQVILGQAEVENEAALQEKRDALEKLISEATGKRETQKRETERAAKALEKGRADKAKFEENARADQAAAELAKRKPAVDAKRTALKLARKAEPLLALERELAAHSTRLKAATKELAAAEAAHRETAAAAKKAADAFAEVEKTKPHIKEHGDRLARLEALLPKVMAFDGLRTQLAGARQAKEAAAKQSDEARMERGRLRKRRDELAEQVEALRKEAESVDALREKKKSIEAAVAAALKLGVARELRAKAGKSIETMQAEFTRAETALAAAGAKRDKLERASREGRAALLARSLEAGKPCPVCGSIEHPTPAMPANAVPSDDELDAARQACETARKKRDSANKEMAKFGNDFASSTAEVRAIEDSLGAQANLPVDELRTALEKCAAAAASAGKAAVAIELRKQESTGVAAALKSLEEVRLTALEKELAAASQAEAQVAAQVEAAEKDVPEDVRTSEAFESARAKLGAEKQKLEKNLAEAAKDLETARAAEGKADALAVERKKQREVADGEWRKAEAGFAAELTGAGFADRAAFAAARMEPAKIDEVDAEISTFGKELAAAEGRVKLAAAAVVDLKPPDIAALDSARRMSADALDALVGELKRHEAMQTNLKNLAGQIAQLDNDNAGLRQKFGVVGRLSEVANGENPARLTLQRFVLGALLEEVLVAATLRLQKMTAGRYEIRRMTTVADARRGAGLDLEILDEYSGQARAVGTLSGGEGFLAALSLALGLSDVVQSQTGGIRMETLFIDEGFGSLDAEALECAFQALVELHLGGRLVGVISHVEELKQRMDVRLEITPSRSGSIATFAGLTAD